MHRYTIEKKQIITRVYHYEILAPSEEYARLKIKELPGDLVESDLVSEEVRILDDENLEE
jgi:hypothetical protein